MAEERTDEEVHGILYAGADPIEEEDQGNIYPESTLTPLATSNPQAPAQPEPAAAEAAEPEAEEPEAVAETDEELASAEAAAEEEPAQEEPADQAEAVADEPEPAADDIRIPKARLDQEAARRRAAENRLRELERQMATGQGQASQPATLAPELDIDISAKAKELGDTLLDGNMDKFSQDFNSIIADVVKQTVNTVRQDTQQQVSQAVTTGVAKSQLDQVIDNLEENFAVFRPGDPEFSNDLVNEALAIRSGFEAQGYTPADAMQQAAQYVLQMHRPEVLAPAQPQAQPAAPKGPSRDVTRNVKAAQQQPPALPQGTNENNPQTYSHESILTLSEEEFDALPDSAVRRLRGDYV